MTINLARLIDRLATLIAVPTHQRLDVTSVGDEFALCQMLANWLGELGPDEVVLQAVPRGDGDPGAYVFARWGTPSLVINAHVDTVPPSSGWTRAPWTPVVDATRVWGLGACDTKGAIACALEALAVTPASARQHIGVLFSGDEENHTAVMQAFLASPHAAGIQRVIVCEPTARQAGIAHRGIMGYRAQAHGPGGHSSRADATPAPLLELARLGDALASLARDTQSTTACGERTMCFNLGQIGGGVAFNVIPQHGEMVWSVRPPPGFDGDVWAREVATLMAARSPAVTQACTLDQPPFYARDTSWLTPTLAAHGISTVQVDFWTEAAWWAQAGVDAVVIGPGDIAAAHAPDESVAIADLEWFTSLLVGVLNTPR